MKVDTLWNISKGLPDPKAWFCNSRGDPKSNGSFIAWPKATSGGTVSTDTIKCCVPNGNLAAEECYIVRVYVPYVREATYDYDKFRNYPVDLNDKKNQKNVERKIARVLQNLGVAYVDRAGLIYSTNDIPASAWFTNSYGKEGIAINPWVLLTTDVQRLVRLIKKEVVHRALYKNLSELSNKIILNFTLDVLSMRVIAQTPYDKLDKITVRLAEKLFNPSVYKKFPILCLTDPSLTVKQVANLVPSQISDIWNDLYAPDKSGFLPPLKGIKPSQLYFRIKALIDDIVIADIKDPATSTSKYPFNVIPSLERSGNTFNDDSAPTISDKKNESLNKAIQNTCKPNKFKNNKSYSNNLTAFWEEQIVQRKDFVDDKLKEFSKKFRTEKLLEELEGKLKQFAGLDEVEVKPYPEELTDTGQILMAIDVCGPKGFPLYFNKDSSVSSNRKKVAAFFDLSGSMQNLLPYMVRITESIEDICDVSFCRTNPDAKQASDDPEETLRGAYAFSDDVIQLTEEDLEKMKKGNIKCGSGTNFDSIITHVLQKIKEDALDVVLCFTDGECVINDEKNIHEFNSSGRKMFKIYLQEWYGDSRDDKGDVTSDLDKLNGDSFTLRLPPIDRF